MTAIVRSTFLALALGGLVLFIYLDIRRDIREQAIAELTRLNEEMAARLAEREAMLSRLGRTRRLGHVEILAQTQGDDGSVLDTEVRLIELDEQGSELARQTFTVPGNVLFIDGWTVKFGHDSVASGHPLRGQTLVLLRRAYSERLAPIDGIPIDTPGAVPPGYAVGDLGRYERQLWDLFWEIAGDAALAESMGVRVAQGEAVYKPVRTGERYELTAGAAEGLSLVPLPGAPARLSRARR